MAFMVSINGYSADIVNVKAIIGTDLDKNFCFALAFQSDQAAVNATTIQSVKKALDIYGHFSTKNNHTRHMESL